MTPHKSISVLGCGWLGLPLAQRMVSLGFDVNGSTTTPEKISLLKEESINPFLIRCDPQIEEEGLEDFFQSKILFLTIPFKRHLKNPTIYQQQIDSIISHVETSNVSYVIFSGSTAVYPDTIGEAFEDKVFEPQNPRAKVLLDIEGSLLNNNHFKSTILRFAGLYGGERLIGRFLASNRIREKTGHFANLVHQDDCVNIVSQIIQKQIYGEILNVCSDQHPTKKDLYTQAALGRGLNTPTFPDAEEQENSKIVRNVKLKKLLNYQFKYPDPMSSL